MLKRIAALMAMTGFQGWLFESCASGIQYYDYADSKMIACWYLSGEFSYVNIDAHAY